MNNSGQDVTSAVAKSSQALPTETTRVRTGDHDDGTAPARQQRRNRRELSAVSGAVSAVSNIWVVTRRQKSATEIDLAKDTQLVRGDGTHEIDHLKSSVSSMVSTE